MVGSGRLAGKVAVITGAARGQGEAAARLFSNEGARVALVDRSDRVAEVAGDLGTSATAHTLDVSDEQGWPATLADVIDRHDRVDILVNNAGITHLATIVECSTADFHRVLDVNLIGTFLGMKLVAPLMARGGGGSIINTSSIQGLFGRAGTPAYTASKFGVRGLSKTAALEFASLGIRVNSIHPGAVDTQLLRDAGLRDGGDVDAAVSNRVPLRRAARPHDVASLLLFLASDESSYITGAEFVIDGGMTAGY